MWITGSVTRATIVQRNVRRARKLLSTKRLSPLLCSRHLAPGRKMSTSQSDEGSGPAKLLLSHFATDQARTKLCLDLIDSLQHAGTNADLDLVSSLVVAQTHPEPRQHLLDCLERRIDSGLVSCAVTATQRQPIVRVALFERIASSLYQASCADAREQVAVVTIRSRLDFLKSAFTEIPFSDAHTAAFRACLRFVSSKTAAIAAPAQHAAFTILQSSSRGNRDSVIRLCHSDIWRSVQALMSDECERQQVSIGTTLWSAWVSQSDRDITSVMGEEYWDLLCQCLRRGNWDERRKCIYILQLSMSKNSSATEEERRDYGRYCTFFRTLVLEGRRDRAQLDNLEELASVGNNLGERWLYALFASGLRIDTHPSTRNFMGNWIMQSGLDPSPAFKHFLQESFLPWATQGSQFVSTLKIGASNVVHCSHADLLTKFLSRMSIRDEGEGDIDRIIWTYANKPKLFLYAKVYLLEAVHQQPASEDWNVNELVVGLSEVARDRIASKLSQIKIAEAATVIEPSNRSKFERRALDSRPELRTQGALVEFWDQLEYLEFPRAMLLSAPGHILNSRLVREALLNEELAMILRDKLTALQKIANKKIHLASALYIALRRCLLEQPDAASTLRLQDIVDVAFSRPSSRTVDMMLDEAALPGMNASYEQYFGPRPGVGTAALLDMVNCVTDHEVVENLLAMLLEKWRKQKPPVPVCSPWKSTLQLQAMLICLERSKRQPRSASMILKDLLYLISIEHLPQYRYLIEWMIVRWSIRHDLEDAVLEQLATKDHHSNPKYLASLMKIANILACASGSDEVFARTLARLLVPLAASSKIVVRHEAQWQIPILMDHARAQGYTALTQNDAIVALDDYIRSLQRFNEPPPDRTNGKFDPTTDHTLSNLVEGRWCDLKGVGVPTATRDDFIKLYEYSLPNSAADSYLPLGPAISRPPRSSANDEPTQAGPVMHPDTVTDTAIALQTKAKHTPFSNRNASLSTQNLIVVGSLVTNPHNIGGLARVSEIFGAGLLTLYSKKVTKNPDFHSVAVSSHLHIPLSELSAAELPAFLAERKTEGFTVVGIEQTDCSHVLGEAGTKLPKKCVLVVGNEREGTPPSVLAECEMLVEIAQRGVTRSLNVQTAAAVALYEWDRQHGGAAVESKPVVVDDLTQEWQIEG